MQTYPINLSIIVLLFITVATVIRGEQCNQPTPYCGTTGFICVRDCLQDSKCKSMGYNHTEVRCGCACQLCDGVIYGPGLVNYSTDAPLSPHQIQQCLHVTHPCIGK